MKIHQRNKNYLTNDRNNLWGKLIWRVLWLFSLDHVPSATVTWRRSLTPTLQPATRCFRSRCFDFILGELSCCQSLMSQDFVRQTLKSRLDSNSLSETKNADCSMNDASDDRARMRLSVCLYACYFFCIFIRFSSHAMLEMWPTQPPWQSSSPSAPKNGLNLLMAFALLAEGGGSRMNTFSCN